MTESLGDEGDPRLEYLPVVLIVTTNGVEVDLLLPPTPTANLHWAQAWKPIRCQCGATHVTCDRADLVLVIGERDHGQHYHPAALVVFVVPRRTYRLPGGAAQVVHSGTDTFGVWASNVISNLVGPQSDPSVWRYNLTDLKRMMSRERLWSCVATSGDLTTLSAEIVSRIPSSAEELHISFCLPDDGTVELAEVGGILNIIQDSIRQDVSIIVSQSWGHRMQVTALHSV